MMSMKPSSPSSYQKLPIAEKRALDLSRARDAAIRCPNCEMAVMPVDMVSHLETRCGGRAEPAIAAKWVTAQDPMVRSVPKGTLSYWVDKGFVRARGPRMDREYLLGDLAKRIAQRWGFRRR